MNFVLSEQMVLVIGEALANSPYKISAPVIAELQKQINAQQQKPDPKPEPMAEAA